MKNSSESQTDMAIVIDISNKCGKKGCEIAPCILPIGSTQEEFQKQIEEQLFEEAA